MISVLVVDDSVVVRRLIVDALGGARNIEVVGTAANGLLAQAKIDQLKPDVVTMDIEMPEMDGIEAVRELRKRHQRLPVIMFSTLSAAGATATLEALAAGATDYVTKPSNVGSIAESIAAVREQLVPKIHALAGRRRARPARPPRYLGRRPAPAAAPRTGRRPPARRAAAGGRTAGPADRRRGSQRPDRLCRHRLLHRRPGRADQGADRACPPTCRCRSWSPSTCRRSSPGCSPSGWTAARRCTSVEAGDGMELAPGHRLHRTRRQAPGAAPARHRRR